MRILLHLLRQGRYGPDEVPPPALTQAGIAEALGTSQSSVSRNLTLLVEGGVVRIDKGHVRNRMLRLKVYSLTPQGEVLARRLSERFRNARDPFYDPGSRPSGRPSTTTDSAGALDGFRAG